MVRQEPSVVLSFSVRIRVAARTEVKRVREQWVSRTAYLTDIFRSAGLEEEGNAFFFFMDTTAKQCDCCELGALVE